MDPQLDLEGATSIAHGAGEILLSYFGSDRVDVRAKGSRDVVTAADIASERFVSQRLKEQFPNDGLIAEEGSEAESRSGRCWHVDPLDGTLNYAHGIPIFCVSLALVERGQPVLGIIHDPVRRETFGAIAGEGAWLGTARLSCSPVEDLAQAVIHLTVDFENESMRQGIQDLNALAPRVLRTRNIGSAALGLAYVASGRFEAMLHRFAHSWDFAAGALLVREAGGQITSMTGRAYDASSFSVAAAGTPKLHGGLMGALS